MNRTDCIERIEKYLLSYDTQPRMVDTYNIEDLKVVKEHFRVSDNEFIDVESYSNHDECPSFDKLFNMLSYKSGVVFLTGLTTTLKLHGEYDLNMYLGQLLQCTSFKCKTVVLCYQCQTEFQVNDIRTERIIYSIDGENTPKPKIRFSAPNVPVPDGVLFVEGINRVATLIESSIADEIYVITNKTKNSYPHSLFELHEEADLFDVLCRLDPSTEILNRSFGSDEQWNTALFLLNESKSWFLYFQKIFGGHSNLNIVANSWRNLDLLNRWMFFIALKLYGVSNNWCLKYASENSKTYDDVVRQVYRSILSIGHDDSEYWNKYEIRKALLNSLGHVEEDDLDYCAMVKSKGRNGLYYLTDSTRIEKEMIFELLDKHGVLFERDALLRILKYVYPDLYHYMLPYRFNNVFLDEYFQTYKYQKIVNKVFPEFEVIVEEQAQKREFYHLLPPRASVVESIEKKGSHLYFMDAMGVEYLGFIIEKCTTLGMYVNVRVCRCELPSLTFCNKEFLQAFKDAGAVIVSGDKGIKKLDDIKHRGEENFDYQYTKLPLHLGRELDIIDEVLKGIRLKLGNGTCDKAVMIADHGASRLAVIKENTLDIDVNSKGSHGGRVCEYTEDIFQIPFATRVEDYYILANYDRFKGGRAASVETHGGATLEEVAVPIVEITLASSDVEITILTPEIKFNTMKKNGIIKLFSKNKISKLSVEIAGVFYDAEAIDSNCFVVKLPDLRKAGVYIVSVYSNDNKIQEGLSFKAEKEGFVERGLL